MQIANVVRLPTKSPDDVSSLEQLIQNGTLNPAEIRAIIAQTEGDGFARGFGLRALSDVLSTHLRLTREEVQARIPMLMIGMTAGVLSPHINVLLSRESPDQGTGQKRLAFGICVTRPILPEEYGTRTQMELVADATRKAMAEARIAEVADVHCVEVKAPQLTPSRIQDARSRSVTLRTANIAESGALSRGASALGVAMGLGEVNPDRLTTEVVCRDWTLYSNVASTSSGSEQIGCKVIVMGNSPHSGGNLIIGHSVMSDTLDLSGAVQAFRSVGLRCEDGYLSPAERERVAAVFVNAGANGTGLTRGRRHTMLSDYLWSYSGSIAKALANVVVGSVLGDSMFLTSAGYEHQGPLEANLVAVVART